MRDSYYDAAQSPKRATRKCADCPMMIASFARKVRCAPCSETYREKMAAKRKRVRRLK